MGNQEYKKILVSFLLSCIVCSQIWLNHIVDDCHFNYITKSEKKNLTSNVPPTYNFIHSTYLHYPSLIPIGTKGRLNG